MLASAMAARSEPRPLSARLRTVKVLGTVRSASDSRLNRTAKARLRSRVGRPFSVPDGTRRERADRSQDDRRIAKTPWEDWSAIKWRDIVPGAQTERRGGAGLVRGLLGGKASPPLSFQESGVGYRYGPLTRERPQKSSAPTTSPPA